MFRRPTPKEQLTQRITVSVIAVTAVLIIVSAAVLFTLGYRLDSGSGRLEQGALLQFDSSPNGADIWIDGEHSGARTGAKRMVIAGEHELIVSRDKYEDWTRTLTVSAGTLTWLDYIRMVPKERPTFDAVSYDSLVSAKASPDRKMYFIQEDKNEPNFSVVDLTSEDVESTSLTLPEDLYSADESGDNVSEFKVRQWDHGGRYVVVTHHVDGDVEWLVVDTKNVSSSRNVTRALGVGARDVQFVGTDGRTLYALDTGGVLRKLDLSNQTISRPLVSNVNSFSIDQDTKIVSYIGVDPDDKDRRVAGVYRDGDATGYILRGTTTDAPLAIATSLYHGNDYIAMSEGGSVTILRGGYPRSAQDVGELDSFASIRLDGHVKSLSFGKGGRFLVAQTDKSYVGYEIEHRRSTVVDFADKGTTLRWLDEAYLWDDISGSLVMRDFDGSNTYSLNSVAKGFDATLSQNGRFMYSIGERDGGFALQRINMTLN